MLIFLTIVFLLVVISFFFTPLRLFFQQPFKVIIYCCRDNLIKFDELPKEFSQSQRQHLPENQTQ